MFFLLVGLPILTFSVSLPIGLTTFGKWVYFISALVIPAALAGRLSPSPSFAIATVRKLLLYLALASPLLLGLGGLSALSNWMTVVTTEETIVSPDGRFVLTHDYIDQGALGGFSHVYIRAKIVPYVVQWDFDVSPMGWPRELAWLDAEHVRIDGQVYEIPRLMSSLAW